MLQWRQTRWKVTCNEMIMSRQKKYEDRSRGTSIQGRCGYGVTPVLATEVVLALHILVVSNRWWYRPSEYRNAQDIKKYCSIHHLGWGTIEHRLRRNIVGPLEKLISNSITHNNFQDAGTTVWLIHKYNCRRGNCGLCSQEAGIISGSEVKNLKDSVNRIKSLLRKFESSSHPAIFKVQRSVSDSITLKIIDAELYCFVNELHIQLILAFDTMCNKLNKLEINQGIILVSISPIIISVTSQDISRMKRLDY